MANGFLGRAMSVANTNVKVYTVPAGVEFATVSIVACNTGAAPATLKVAVSLADTPAVVDHIEYGAALEANGGILQINCIILSAGEKLIVNASTATVAVRVHGLEQA